MRKKLFSLLVLYLVFLLIPLVRGEFTFGGFESTKTPYWCIPPPDFDVCREKSCEETMGGGRAKIYMTYPRDATGDSTFYGQLNTSWYPLRELYQTVGCECQNNCKLYAYRGIASYGEISCSAGGCDSSKISTPGAYVEGPLAEGPFVEVNYTLATLYQEYPEKVYFVCIDTWANNYCDNGVGSYGPEEYNAHVVNCYEDGNCDSGKVCDKSGSWDTWYCRSEPTMTVFGTETYGNYYVEKTADTGWGGAGMMVSASPPSIVLDPCSKSLIVKAYGYPYGSSCAGCVSEGMNTTVCVWDSLSGTKLNPDWDTDCSSMGFSCSVWDRAVMRNTLFSASSGMDVMSRIFVAPASCQQARGEIVFFAYCGEERYEPCKLNRTMGDDLYRCWGSWQQKCVGGFYTDEVDCPFGCNPDTGQCQGCTEEWLNEYQCSGSWVQRKWRNTDCSEEWRNWEDCAPSTCSNGQCVSCSAMWLDAFQCSGSWSLRLWQNTDCSTEFKNYEECTTGCDPDTGRCYTPTITDCREISSSGYYTLGSNITADDFGTDCKYDTACILISADDVELDLNGYTIKDTTGCYYGVGAGFRAGSQNNVIVENGRIERFNWGGVGFYNVNGGEIKSLTVFSPSVGDGVRLEGPANRGVNIHDNTFDTNDYSVKASCSENCWIVSNDLLSFDGVFLNGRGFLVEKNSFGSYTDNTGEHTPCERYETPVTHSLTCDFCFDSTIRDNYVIADEDFRFLNNAHETDTMFNEFHMPAPKEIGDIIPAYYDSSTYNNTFCDNSITAVFLSIDENGICWWRRESKNGADYVEDLGSGNKIIPHCEEGCVPGYYCDEDDRVYINAQCVVVERYTCEYGCEAGECIGETVPSLPSCGNGVCEPELGETSDNCPEDCPPTPPEQQPGYVSGKYNISWMEPIVNATTFREANALWMVPFFTPFFLALMGMFATAGILTWFSKSAVVGGLVILAMIMAYGFIGIIPIWIVILLVIFAGLLVAWALKGVIT